MKRNNLFPFDEINALHEELQSFGDGDGRVRPTADKEHIEDIILDLLIYQYVMGVQSGGTDLGIETEVDTDKMNEAIYTKIDGKTWKDRVDEYVANEGTIEEIFRVADTDGTRIFNTGITDVAKKSGNGTKKTWWTMEDEKVRDTHRLLEGITIPYSDKFFTQSGDSAYAPGGFATPQENANCRCWLQLSKG